MRLKDLLPTSGARAAIHPDLLWCVRQSETPANELRWVLAWHDEQSRSGGVPPGVSLDVIYSTILKILSIRENVQRDLSYSSVLPYDHIDLSLLQPSDVVSVETAGPERGCEEWEAVGWRTPVPIARFGAPYRSWHARATAPGRGNSWRAWPGAARPRLVSNPMYGATPGLSHAPGLAGIHRATAAAPIRDFSYNLRKLRKCQHMYLAETADRGIGVFAAQEFAPGDVVMMDFDGDYYDQVLTYRELCTGDIDLKYPLQVGRDLFRVPSGSIDDFTNHSCDPNTGIRLYPNGTIILAIRKIRMHEEITFDYSTYLNNPYEKIRCRCGAAACRGVIGNFITLPRELRHYYLALGIVGDFAVQGGGADDAED